MSNSSAKHSKPNIINNKPIYRCLYDLQKNPKEEYVNGNIVWVPLCTNIQK